MPSLLELKNILIRRGKHNILAVDSLRIDEGEFVGIVGPNGAGKTTLLHLCCGTIHPTQGQIFFDGENMAVSPWRPLRKFRQHIGYVPQQAEYNSHLPFTLREIVALGRNSRKPLIGKLNREDYQQIDYWLDKLGLYQRRNQTFRSLSGGQQQKALIARGMVSDPRLVLLDEPGANLDPNWKNRLRETLSEMFSQNKITVLVVSHEWDLLPEACRRVVVLNKGQILTDTDKTTALAAAQSVGDDL